MLILILVSCQFQIFRFNLFSEINNMHTQKNINIFKLKNIICYYLIYFNIKILIFNYIQYFQLVMFVLFWILDMCFIITDDALCILFCSYTVFKYICVTVYSQSSMEYTQEHLAKKKKRKCMVSKVTYSYCLRHKKQ